MSDVVRIAAVSEKKISLILLMYMSMCDILRFPAVDVINKKDKQKRKPKRNKYFRNK